jgi:CubicO group peptidase (beta-lactamase class C family)
VGYVVGLVDESGGRIVSYGSATREGGRPVDGDTVFQVGSVTKVFTSLLLAEMAGRGEVRLDDPIALYLPAGIETPRARNITLLHLSRHTAGFMSFADEFGTADLDEPMAAQSNETLFAFLDKHPMRSTAGAHHTYSSYGVALLGELLARRAGADFESAVRTRIFEPLGMVRSGFALTPELRAAHATGHTSRGNPRRFVEASGMLGSGALRSTANDLVRFVQAHLGLRATTLGDALRATQQTRADRQRPDLPMGLGWFYADYPGTRVVWHGGSAPGFRAYVGMDLQRKRGVIVLANSDNDVANLGMHLVEPYVPLHSPEPPREFKAIVAQPRLLDEYAGAYRIVEPPGVLSFRRQGDGLLATSPHGTWRFLAESDTSFFAEDMENWGTFTRDATGRVDGFTWHRENWQRHLPRSPDGRSQ